MIFGSPGLGLPALGVVGAALGTAIARMLESVALVVYAYAARQPLAGRLNELFSFKCQFFMRFLSITVPLTFNESLKSFGFTIYSIVYARIGTVAVAAASIAFTIKGLTFAVYIGLANGNAILIGNRIGAGEEEEAHTDARRAIILGIMVAVLLGTILFATQGLVLPLNKVSAEAQILAQDVLAVLGCFSVARAMNMILIVAILRGGRYPFHTDH